MKSHARGFLPLLRALMFDCARMCQASMAELQRDFLTIDKRCENEGLSFLTIALPEFGKAFEQSLEKAQVDHSEFPGWKFQKRLPAFLRGFVSLVFDSATGGLLDEPSIPAIRSVRQIAYTFKKLGMPCSSHRERKALDGYIETERILEGSVFDDEMLDMFSQTSHLLWGNAFSDFDCFELIPKHGPGAVVEHLTQNSKYRVRRWHARLEPFFPVDANGFCNIDHCIDEVEQLDVASEVDEWPVKVTLVPKTLKTPRVIAIEPSCMQMAQQALKAYLVRKLESYWLTAGHVNFTDQTINQRLAVTASSDKSLATLDMSEASDRVHLLLVQRMLQTAPDLLGALEASRTKQAVLPDGHIVHLTKFASMGSATCFPIEAMVFFTIIVATRLRERGLPVTLRSIFDVSRDVYVYGDDIIVPADEALVVSDSLRRYNCKVNTHKSFFKGHFRESCGADAYQGNLVTPIYHRATWPETRHDASRLISLVATGNQYYLNGYYQASEYVRKRVEAVLGPLPVVNDDFPGLGWVNSFLDPPVKKRYNKRLQRLEIQTYVPVPLYKVDKIEGWPCLFKFFLTHTASPSDGHKFCGPTRGMRYAPGSVDTDSPKICVDIVRNAKDHLERVPRHGAVGIQRQWVAPISGATAAQ